MSQKSIEETLTEVFQNNRNALTFIRSWDSSAPTDVQKAKLDEIISANQVLIKSAGISPGNESLAEAVINTATGQIPLGTSAAVADEQIKADIIENGVKDNSFTESTENQNQGEKDLENNAAKIDKDANIGDTKANASKIASKITTPAKTAAKAASDTKSSAKKK